MQTKEPWRREQHAGSTAENGSCLVSGLRLSCVKRAAYGGIQLKSPLASPRKEKKIKKYNIIKKALCGCASVLARTLIIVTNNILNVFRNVIGLLFFFPAVQRLAVAAS